LLLTVIYDKLSTFTASRFWQIKNLYCPGLCAYFFIFLST
jgi:hypothetical protein